MEKIKTIRDNISTMIATPAANDRQGGDALCMDTAFDGLPLANFTPVSCFAVKRILKSLPWKSCSLDSIPTELLMENADHVVATITKILDASFTTGTVPTQLKKVNRQTETEES